MVTNKNIVLAALGTYRLTRLIIDEAGPGDVLCRIRNKIYKKAFQECKRGNFWQLLNGLVTCEYCFSVWTAALMTVFATKAGKNRFAEWVLIWLGLAGAFGIIQEIKDAKDRV